METMIFSYYFKI